MKVGCVEKRAIKARLIARGFKDLQATRGDLHTFSGTASFSSQRVVNATAAQYGFVLCTIDISAAFLKGTSFHQIAEITGEPLRSVQFSVAPEDAALLRQSHPQHWAPI